MHVASIANNLENDAADEDTYEMRFKKNKVVFQSQVGGKTGQEETARDWENKFKKQLELSQGDAAVIE